MANYQQTRTNLQYLEFLFVHFGPLKTQQFTDETSSDKVTTESYAEL